MRKTLFFSFIAATLLSGCDSMRSTLGLDHYQPDEFNISADNPPLSVPPDFSLRPPKESQQSKGCAVDNTSCRRAQDILGIKAQPATKDSTQSKVK